MVERNEGVKEVRQGLRRMQLAATGFPGELMANQGGEVGGCNIRPAAGVVVGMEAQREGLSSTDDVEEFSVAAALVAQDAAGISDLWALQ